MNVKIRKVDLTKLDAGDVEGINSMLMNSKSASIFHTIEWNHLLIDFFKLHHVALVARVDETDVGLYILHGCKENTYRSPAIDLQSAYGGPISIEDDPQIIHCLLQEAEQIFPLANFQIWSPPGVSQIPFRQNGYSAEEMYTPILDLNCPEEEQWLKIHRKKRSAIRKALNEGAVIEEAGFSHIDEYCNMVAETLGRDGINSLPLSFYHRVIDELAPLGLAKMFIVKLKDHPISGTIVLCYKDTVYGWDIGWHREFSSISPNDLLVWGVAKSSSQEGYKYFDLLRFEPDRLPGIARWKEAFGGEIATCFLLRKTTTVLRLFHPVKILFTQPSRAFRKMRSLFQKDTA